MCLPVHNVSACKGALHAYLIVFASIHNVQVGSAWFNVKQRAIATMVIALSNPMGVLVPSFISPRLVCSSVSL